jgi:hypothetical protein
MIHQTKRNKAKPKDIKILYPYFNCISSRNAAKVLPKLQYKSYITIRYWMKKNSSLYEKTNIA